MAGFTATVERAEDGSWSALAVIGEHSIFGEGDTREAALDNLREGIEGLVDYLKNKGQKLPEVVTVEVAAA